MRPILLLLSMALATAPFQCSSEADPDKRREETPAEALHALATEFQKAGDREGQVRTLSYLVKHYPRSRHAVEAHQELSAMGIALPDPMDSRDAKGSSPVAPAPSSAAAGAPPASASAPAASSGKP